MSKISNEQVARELFDRGLHMPTDSTVQDVYNSLREQQSKPSRSLPSSRIAKIVDRLDVLVNFEGAAWYTVPVSTIAGYFDVAVLAHTPKDAKATARSVVRTSLGFTARGSFSIYTEPTLLDDEPQAPEDVRAGEWFTEREFVRHGRPWAYLRRVK